MGDCIGYTRNTVNYIEDVTSNLARMRQVEGLAKFIQGTVMVSEMAKDKGIYDTINSINDTNRMDKPLTSADDFVSDLTYKKYNNLAKFIKHASAEEMRFVQKRSEYVLKMLASQWEGGLNDIRRRAGIAKSVYNVMDYTYRHANAMTKVPLLSGGIGFKTPEFMSSIFKSVFSIDLPERITLLSNQGRMFRAFRNTTQIYQTANEVDKSVASILPLYTRAAIKLTEKAAASHEGPLDPQMVAELAYIKDYNQSVAYTGGDTKQAEAQARRLFDDILTKHYDITDAAQKAAGWLQLGQFQADWNKLMYGHSNPTGDQLTKAYLTNINNVKNSTVIEDLKRGSVSIPPYLFLVLNNGNKLRSMTNFIDGGNGVVSKEVSHIRNLFTDDDDTGFKIRKNYMPTAVDEHDMHSGFFVQTHTVERLASDPSMLRARNDLARDAKVGQHEPGNRDIIKTFSGTIKAMSEYFERRSEYFMAAAIKDDLKKNMTAYKSQNSAAYDVLHSFSDQMLRDYVPSESGGKVEGRDIAPHVRAIKSLFGGVLGLTAGTILTQSGVSNLTGGFYTSSIENPYFGKEQSQRAMRKRYTAALESSGEDQIIAKTIQEQYKFLAPFDKVSDMVDKEIKSNISNAYKEGVRDLSASITGGKFEQVKALLGRYFETGKTPTTESIARVVEDTGSAMTKTAELLVNNFMGLIDPKSGPFMSFNRTEGLLFRIAEAQSFELTKTAVEMWKTGLDKPPTELEIREKTAQFAREMSTDIFNMAKSNMGDFSKYNKPVWAWRTLRDAKTSSQALRGFVATGLYMFKTALSVNIETLNKQISAMMTGTKAMMQQDSKVGSRNVGYSYAAAWGMMGLGLYQLLAEMLRDEETRRTPVPVPPIATRQSPYSDPIMLIKSLMQSANDIAVMSGGFPVTEDVANDTVNRMVRAGRNTTSILAWTGGPIFGMGMSRAGIVKAADFDEGLVDGVIKSMSLKFDFGYNFFTNLFGGILTKTEPGSYDYLNTMRRGMDSNIIFNNNNDILRSVNTLAFALNKAYTWAREGFKEEGHLATAQQALWNELKGSYGAALPVRFAQRRNWGRDDDEHFLRTLRYRSERMRRRAQWASDKERRDMEYNMSRMANAVMGRHNRSMQFQMRDLDREMRGLE